MAWQRWYEGRKARFEYGFGRRLAIFFFDTRFARYWENLIRLDFGVSLVSREPVLGTLLSKLRYSLSLSVASLLLSYLIAVPLGVFSAVRKGSRADQALTLALFMLYSLPSFFVATLLLYFFSLGSNFPALRSVSDRRIPEPGRGGHDHPRELRDLLWHLALPLVCLTYGSLAALSRYTRTGLLDVIGADYIERRAQRACRSSP